MMPNMTGPGKGVPSHFGSKNLDQHAAKDLPPSSIARKGGAVTINAIKESSKK
jgi:hypothetical protein